MFHRPTLFFASSFEKKTVHIIIIALHAVPVRQRALLLTHERRPPSTVRPTSPSIVAVPDDTRASRRAGSRFTASRGSRRLRGARCRARDPNAPDAIARRDGRGATRLERRRAVGRARATRRIRGMTRDRPASSSAAAQPRGARLSGPARVARRLGFCLRADAVVGHRFFLHPRATREGASVVSIGLRARHHHARVCRVHPRPNARPDSPRLLPRPAS